jgi:hypothetical protein
MYNLQISSQLKKKVLVNQCLICISLQGSHYFQIRGRSDFSFRELTGRSERQQREVVRLPREVNCD